MMLRLLILRVTHKLGKDITLRTLPMIHLPTFTHLQAQIQLEDGDGQTVVEIMVIRLMDTEGDMGAAEGD